VQPRASRARAASAERRSSLNARALAFLVRATGDAYEVTTETITAGGVRDLRRAAGAGMEDEVRPHDFRRSVSGELLDAGTDLATVARLLGHANVTTTVRCDRRPDVAVASAVSRPRLS
jgi:site-specific recombinase XerD